MQMHDEVITITTPSCDVSFRISHHAQHQLELKGINHQRLLDCLNNGTMNTSRNHPGQYRMTDGNLCLVLDKDKLLGSDFCVVTLYLDKVITPLRPDQIARGDKRFRQ